MPLFAKSKSAAVLGLAVAFFANLQFGFGMPTFIERYCGFATGLMPFAVGAVACHYRDSLRRFAHPGLSIVVWCAHGLYWLADPYWPWTYGLWLSVPLSAWVVLSLVEAKAGAADKFAGELSYPVYLLHTTVAAWFLPHFGFGRSFLFFAVSFAVTLLASWGMLRLIDAPVQRLKPRVEALLRAKRGRARTPSTQPSPSARALPPGEALVIARSAAILGSSPWACVATS